MCHVMEEDVPQRRICSRLEGMGKGEGFMVGKAWFPLAWDLRRPPVGLGLLPEAWPFKTRQAHSGL